MYFFFFFQAEDGIRDFCLSRGLGDVYKRQVVDTSNVLYLTGGILLCLKKVKGKDTDPDSTFYVRQVHSPTFGNKTANIYVLNLAVYNCV